MILLLKMCIKITTINIKDLKVHTQNKKVVTIKELKVQQFN